MPRIALLTLALFAACSDPGPRDRSLARRGETFPVHPDVFTQREPIPVLQPPAVASNVGLEVDALAPLYPTDARLVIRCSDLTTLNAHARARLANLAALLPGWGLPELPPGTLLRVNCVIPDLIVIDHSNPFAFVQTDAGWVVLLPIQDSFTDSEFLRRVDDRYCVAGSSEALDAYAPGGRPGHFLSGDLSIAAHADAVPDLGRRLTEAAATLDIKVPGLADLPGVAFAGIERVDLALHCLESTVRADLRVVPNAERAPALATLVAALDARRGSALGRLPENGMMTLAAGCDVASLLTMATRFGAVQPDTDAPGTAAALQTALSMLGDDTAVTLHLDGKARPTLRMVAELTQPERRTAQKFLGSKAWDSMLAELAGFGHSLIYEPSALEPANKAAGTHVAKISGSPAGPQLAALKAWPVLGESLARLFAGGDRIRVALVGNRLCVAVGESAQEAVGAMIDRIRTGNTDGAARTNGIRERALMEGSFDAAALLALAHQQNLAPALRRLPVDFAIATEGDALRLTIRMPLERIAEQWSEPSPRPAAPAEPSSPTRD